MKTSNDDYDDDFEDYENDDFEDDAESPQKPNIAPPKSIAADNYSDSKTKSQSKYINSTVEPTKSDSKQANKTNSNFKTNDISSTSSRIKKFDNMQISFTQTSSDPRAVRIKKLIDSGVLDLQMERFTQCQVLPTTKYEFYINALRMNTCNLRQIGVPMDLEKRDMSTETEIIECNDKSIQFSYGHDDTDFYNLLQDMQLLKKGIKTIGNKLNDRESSLQQCRSAGYEVYHNAQESDNVNDITELQSSTSVGEGATRLTSFLQRASFICEGILQDEADDNSTIGSKVQHGESNSKSDIFDSDSDWIQLGKDVTKGSNEPIRTRRICYLQFSSLQPNLVLSAHPYPTVNAGTAEEDLDLKPFKGLYSVWDIAYPGCPLYVLEATGQPTCCCFSSTQSHLVVAGTNEGTLHLWDLRENSSFHKDRDSIDLRIDRGIRKPCYSTNLSYASTTLGDTNAESIIDSDFQHSSPIIQIESLSPYDHLSVASVTTNATTTTGSSLISQFVSIDESGLVIFWTTSQMQRIHQDLQCSPWSGVALIQTRQLRTISLPSSQLSAPTMSVTKGQNQTSAPTVVVNRGQNSIHAGKSLLAVIPEDVSTILVTKSEGTIAKLSRFGLPEAPHTLHRCHNYSIDIATESNSVATANSKKNVSNTSPEVNYFSAISCIAVRSPIHHAVSDDDSKDVNETKSNKALNKSTDSAPLVLVGRLDGTVDLFQVDVEYPIQSWDLNCYLNSPSTKTSDKLLCRVVKLHWCSTRASVYFAVDSNGNIFYFDLNHNSNSPISVENIKITNKISPGLIDISKSVLNTGLFNMVVTIPNKKTEGDIIKTKRGNKNIAKVVNKSQLFNEEVSFRSSLHRLSTEKFSMQSVTFIPSNSASSNSDYK